MEMTEYGFPALPAALRSCFRDVRRKFPILAPCRVRLSLEHERALAVFILVYIIHCGHNGGQHLYTVTVTISLPETMAQRNYHLD